MSLVIKSWYASKTPNANGNFVEIAARKPGAFAWLLALFNIDPSFFLHVAFHQVTFSQSSFQGYKKIVVTTENVSSTFYGYSRPWTATIAIFLAFLGVAVPLVTNQHGQAAFIMVLVGIAAAAAYYLYNKELLIGFSEMNGDDYSLKLKRSVIEGQEISEDQMKQVTDIILLLIRKNKMSSTPRAPTG
jgi:hypothetical protein